jgi:hypothetical protein
MDNFFGMKIFDSNTDLSNKDGCLSLWNLLALLDFLIKLPIQARFKEKVNIILIRKYSIHSCNVGMGKKLLNFYFRTKLILNLLMLNSLFRYDFHCT